MATCNRCRHHFRTLEDEEGMHDCSYCGYDGHEDMCCLWCGGMAVNEVYAPYCSHDCAFHAELDSIQDRDAPN